MAEDQQELQIDPWSAYAAEVISSISLSDSDQEIREVSLQPDAVESILNVLDAKAGWIQEDESKLFLRKALFSVERGNHNKVGANRGGFRSCSGHHTDDHLGHSAEGRRAVVKAVRTEPQHTLERSSTTLREHSLCQMRKVKRALSRQLLNLWCTLSWKPENSAKISRAKKRERGTGRAIG